MPTDSDSGREQQRQDARKRMGADTGDPTVMLQRVSEAMGRVDMLSAEMARTIRAHTDEDVLRRSELAEAVEELREASTQMQRARKEMHLVCERYEVVTHAPIETPSSPSSLPEGWPPPQTPAQAILYMGLQLAIKRPLTSLLLALALLAAMGAGTGTLVSRFLPSPGQPPSEAPSTPVGSSLDS